MRSLIALSALLLQPEILGKGLTVGFSRIAISNENILAAWSGDDGIQLATMDTRIR